MAELRHVWRARLPWRDEPPKTECGRESSDALMQDELVALVKRLGRQRASMQVCMTCWATTQHHAGVWEKDPVGVVLREASRARWEAGSPLRVELEAMVLLVDAHRGEFDQLVESLRTVTRLDKRRRA